MPTFFNKPRSSLEESLYSWLGCDTGLVVGRIGR